MEPNTFGWRQLLGAINLRDFSGMVAAELGMIGLSVRFSIQSFVRPPFGPLISLGGMLLVAVRLALLVLVVVVFGTAILTIMAVRGTVGIGRSRIGAR